MSACDKPAAITHTHKGPEIASPKPVTSFVFHQAARITVWSGAVSTAAEVNFDSAICIYSQYVSSVAAITFCLICVFSCLRANAALHHVPARFSAALLLDGGLRMHCCHCLSWAIGLGNSLFGQSVGTPIQYRLYAL